MSGSTFGTLFKISTWGESHGKALGVVVDGCPAGLNITEEDIQEQLNRRKPGDSKYTTPRKESDKIEILSGVFEGKTTGTPISMLVYNTNQHSKDYSNIKDVYRPGHADYTYDARYGFRDFRGGGRSSGRETLSRVAAGAIAKKLLEEFGIEFTTYTKTIGHISVCDKNFDTKEILNNDLCMPDREAYKKACDYLDDVRSSGNSAGGIVECVVKNYPAGCGNPVFEKLDAKLAQAIMSIGSVKGIEIGSGFNSSYLKGSENNDPIITESNGKIIKQSNNAGGILGGISDGSPIILRAAIKPTPSISMEQKTINTDGEATTIQIHGRHDPIIVPRAVVVIESMVAITLADALLQMPMANINNLKKILDR